MVAKARLLLKAITDERNPPKGPVTEEAHHLELSSLLVYFRIICLLCASSVRPGTLS